MIGEVDLAIAVDIELEIPRALTDGLGQLVNVLNVQLPVLVEVHDADDDRQAAVSDFGGESRKVCRVRAIEHWKGKDVAERQVPIAVKKAICPWLR